MMTVAAQCLSWVKSGRFDGVRNAASGLPRGTDIGRPARLVRFVPQLDSCTE